jgi:hypothetical protein
VVGAGCVVVGAGCVVVGAGCVVVGAGCVVVGAATVVDVTWGRVVVVLDGPWWRKWYLESPDTTLLALSTYVPAPCRASRWEFTEALATKPADDTTTPVTTKMETNLGIL